MFYWVFFFLVSNGMFLEMGIVRKIFCIPSRMRVVVMKMWLTMIFSKIVTRNWFIRILVSVFINIVFERFDLCRSRGVWKWEWGYRGIISMFPATIQCVSSIFSRFTCRCMSKSVWFSYDQRGWWKHLFKCDIRSFFFLLFQRCPILVYIHHEKALCSHIFCLNILCSEVIVNCLLNNYIVWAWDITYSANRDV